MNNLDLNRLEVFFFVYRGKSVSEAAGRLHITRSAVSQQIGKLERELHVKLFLRTNRNMIPTPEAEILYPVLEDFFSKLKEKADYLERGKNEPVGKLRIGAPIVFGETFIIDSVAEFKKKYPRVSFELSFMNQPWVLSEKVLAGELDFAIVDLVDVAQKGIPVAARPVIVERQVLAGNKDLLGSWKNRRMPLDEVIKLPIIDYLPNGEATKLWCREMYGRIPGELNIVFSCQNLHAMIRGAKRGLGLGLIPSYLIEKELKSGQLIKVKTSKPDYENEIGLVQAPERRPSLAEKFFIDMVMTEMKKRGKYL